MRKTTEPAAPAKPRISKASEAKRKKLELEAAIQEATALVSKIPPSVMTGDAIRAANWKKLAKALHQAASAREVNIAKVREKIADMLLFCKAGEA